MRLDQNVGQINKRFDMVPGNFEKVPDDKAVPLSTADLMR